MTRAITDMEVLNDYIADRLPQGERDAFESRLVSDATLVQELEESLRLREGLEILRERDRLAPPRPVRRRRAVAIALTSAAAAVFAGVVLYVGLPKGDRAPAVLAGSIAGFGLDRGGSNHVAGPYSFASMRDASTTPRIELPPDGLMEFRILPSAVDAGRRYRVSLDAVRGGERYLEIGSADHLSVDDDGFVAFYADASKLAPGEYSLSVKPEFGPRPAQERYGLRLLPPHTETPAGS